MKVEKERLALEESNNQAAQELQKEWNQLKEGASVVTDEETSKQTAGSGEKNDTVQSQVAENTEAKAGEDTDEELQEEEQDYDMQIVILGDSIMDNDR